MHGLQAIPRSRVYSEVARQLQTRIVNKLKPGDMLPPERELVRRFGVSRGSIRDAIRSLEVLGLLEPRQGIGTVVREPSAEAVLTQVASALLQEQKVIRELLDVRNIIEPALARRAALHATSEQIAEMHAILDHQTETVRAGGTGIKEDSAFHYAIALAADNGTMMKLVRVLMDLLHEARERFTQKAGRAEKSLAGHWRILTSLERRDEDGAEQAMRRHLSEIERLVLEKL